MTHANTKALLAVERVLSVQSDLALARFVALNPHQRGIAWADALDMLDDSDSNLEYTEPVWEALDARGFITDETRLYVNLVALTLLWASDEGHPPSPFDVEGAVTTVLGGLDDA